MGKLTVIILILEKNTGFRISVICKWLNLNSLLREENAHDEVCYLLGDCHVELCLVSVLAIILINPLGILDSDFDPTDAVLLLSDAR